MKTEIRFSKNFRKRYKKAPHFIQRAFQKKLYIFERNPKDTVLRNHRLSGKYSIYRSIDITGDWRALYGEISNGKFRSVLFEELGTHSQLYGK